MIFPYHFEARPDKALLVEAFKGKRVHELPTPALLVDKVKFEANCTEMLDNVHNLRAEFRVHVKTHKTLEGTKLALGAGSKCTSKIVVSTMAEAWFMLPLVSEGLVTDILFGLPLTQSKIDELDALRNKVPNLRLMIDNLEQVDFLVDYNKTRSSSKRWSLFIKIDMGTKRAGFDLEAQAFKDLLHKCLREEDVRDEVDIYGFYCHAGHSYGSDSKDTAKKYLIDEIDAANKAAGAALRLDGALDLHISVGATPTAHTSGILDANDLIDLVGPLHGTLELHAGNYSCCDLQQVATGCTSLERVSTSVLTEVISTYPDRGNKKPGEQLINAGAIALSKDQGQIPGFGTIVEPETHANWVIGRISQEHGVLVPTTSESPPEFIPLGTKLRIIPQHICLTCAAFSWYFAVQDGQVVDVWVPCKGW